MKIEIIDLYAHFNIPRGGADAGYLKLMIADETAKNVTTPRQRPGILICPGGGYQFVSPREGEPIALNFLAKGFNAFILDYSVSKPYPNHLIECALAMIYLRQNNIGCNLIKEKLAIIGFSAGAHLACSLSLLCGSSVLTQNQTIKTLAGDKGLEKLLKPNAQILCYPVITSRKGYSHQGSFERLTLSDSALADKVSLEKRVTKKAPPTFIWHTADDDSVPVFNSLMLANALSKKGVRYELHIYEHGTHGLSVADKTTSALPPDCSKSVHSWMKNAIDWLIEQNFCIN